MRQVRLNEIPADTQAHRNKEAKDEDSDLAVTVAATAAAEPEMPDVGLALWRRGCSLHTQPDTTSTLPDTAPGHQCRVVMYVSVRARQARVVRLVRLAEYRCIRYPPLNNARFFEHVGERERGKGWDGVSEREREREREQASERASERERERKRERE